MKAEAELIRLEDRGRGAKHKDMRDITLTDVDVAGDLLLTNDASETPLTGGFYYKADSFKGPVCHMYSKLCMYDADGYGITAGTEVTVDGDVGVVQSTVRDKVEAGFEGETRKLSVLEILRYANPGQGILSVEADQRKFVLLCLCSCLAINVHVLSHVDEDAKIKENKNVYVVNLRVGITKLEAYEDLMNESASALRAAKEQLTGVRKQGQPPGVESPLQGPWR